MMIGQWQHVEQEYPLDWEKMVGNFYKVHQQHLHRVMINMHHLTNYFQISNAPFAGEIVRRSYSHDNSKIEAPEYIPYVWRYWRTKWKADGEPKAEPAFHIESWESAPFHLHFQDPTLDQAIRDAVFHHITHNRHHPEWHDDPDNMTHLDICEMVADWYAMSDEFNSNIYDWYRDVVPRRYHFGKKQQLVLDTIDIVTQQKLKSQQKG